MQRRSQSQADTAKDFGVSHSVISNLVNCRATVSDTTVVKIMRRCERADRVDVDKIDNARERVRNYIDDHAGEYTPADFARAIGEPASMVADYLSDDETRMYRMPTPVLHTCAKVMGITYTKLVKSLSPVDYV